MSLPWFKMYGSAFLVDTMRLSTEQRGAYLMLMLDYYDKEAPPPDDDAVLSQITGLSLERWRAHRRSLETFFIVDMGVWRHARCDEELVSRQTKIDANRKNGKRPKSQRKATGKATGLPNGYANGVPTEQASSEPDFGPTTPYVTEPSHSATENGTNVPHDTQQEATGLPSGLATGSPNGSQSLDKKNIVEEGANAPSPAIGLSIGSLMPDDFRPANEVIALALNEGVASTELAGWLDDWKQRCIEAGTRTPNWHAAWDREYHRRMTERAKAKPKPRVAVSKKRMDKIPDNWAPNDRHHELAHERRLDIRACVESFADYILTKRPDWRDADASFRNWLKSPHRTEFLNGQATQRRAPAPGGRGSIVDAIAELDAEFARRGAGGALAEDQPHGGAVVLSLPED